MNMKARTPRPAKKPRLLKRENEALLYIGGWEPSAKKLAELLKVSIPTVRRVVAALRRKGFTINVTRRDDGWHYVRPDPPPMTPEELKNDPLIRMLGFYKGPIRPFPKGEDADIYDWD